MLFPIKWGKPTVGKSGSKNPHYALQAARIQGQVPASLKEDLVHNFLSPGNGQDVERQQGIRFKCEPPCLC